MIGLVVDGAGFEILASGERVGSRRPIKATDVALLTELAGRYVRAVQAGADDSVFRCAGPGAVSGGWMGIRGS